MDNGQVFPTETWVLHWYKATPIRGCFIDAVHEVLIVGGTTAGPMNKGGEAVWSQETGREQLHISEFSIIIYTNGDKFSGKGLHSTKPDGSIRLYLNENKICDITCNSKGLYDDYWPSDSPSGTAHCSTGWNRTERLILNRTADFRIKVDPYTVLDINKIEFKIRKPQ